MSSSNPYSIWSAEVENQLIKLDSKNNFHWNQSTQDDSWAGQDESTSLSFDKERINSREVKGTTESRNNPEFTYARFYKALADTSHSSSFGSNDFMQFDEASYTRKLRNLHQGYELMKKTDIRKQILALEVQVQYLRNELYKRYEYEEKYFPEAIAVLPNPPAWNMEGFCNGSYRNSPGRGRGRLHLNNFKGW